MKSDLASSPRLKVPSVDDEDADLSGATSGVSVALYYLKSFLDLSHCHQNYSLNHIIYTKLNNQEG